MAIFNLNGDEWNEETEHEGFAFKDCWVGARIGSELIGGSMYEVAPGKKQGPYHTHLELIDKLVDAAGISVSDLEDPAEALARATLSCTDRPRCTVDASVDGASRL